MPKVLWLRTHGASLELSAPEPQTELFTHKEKPRSQFGNEAFLKLLMDGYSQASVRLAKNGAEDSTDNLFLKAAAVADSTAQNVA